MQFESLGWKADCGRRDQEVTLNKENEPPETEREFFRKETRAQKARKKISIPHLLRCATTESVE